MDKSKKIILSAVVVVVILIVTILVIISNSKILIFSDSSFGFLKSIQPITTAKKTVTSTDNSRVFNAEKNIPLYVDMVKKFGGNRFQFSSDCTLVSPNSFVIKSGVQFMIDNRDSKAHVFNFSGQKYDVSGYGYAIVTASKIGIQPVFCNNVQRVMVNVQK